MNSSRKSFAVYAITKHGIATAAELIQKLPDADLYISEKLFAEARSRSELSRAIPLSLPMGPRLTEIFTDYNCHIFIISVGAVVRMIAPLIRDKKVDPAVVCIDDAGRFAVCLLSGHVGRGNHFTNQIADILGAQSVVTTASDAIGTLTVDILGRDLGWVLDDADRNVTRGCAAVVNATPVLFVQETGESNWWPENRPLPEGVRYTTSLEGVDPNAFEILLIATDREIRETSPAHWENSVIYRPKSLVLGVGCDKGASAEMVIRGMKTILEQHSLSPKSIKKLATIDKKKEEPGLLELAAFFDCPLQIYSSEELDSVAGIENPSEKVKQFVGTRGVAEPAALLASGAERLLIPKQRYTEPNAGRSMTLAVARIPFPKREEVFHA